MRSGPKTRPNRWRDLIYACDDAHRWLVFAIGIAEDEGLELTPGEIDLMGDIVWKLKQLTGSLWNAQTQEISIIARAGPEDPSVGP